MLFLRVKNNNNPLRAARSLGELSGILLRQALLTRVLTQQAARCTSKCWTFCCLSEAAFFCSCMYKHGIFSAAVCVNIELPELYPQITTPTKDVKYVLIGGAILQKWHLL